MRRFFILRVCINNARVYLLCLLCGLVFELAWADQQWTEVVELANSSATQPSVATWANNVYVVWSDDRLKSNEIFFRQSADGGEHWSIDQRVTQTIANSIEPDIDLDRRNLYLVWQEEETIKFALYDGMIWKHQTILSTNGRRPRIAVTKIFPNNFIYVVWQQTSSSESVQLFDNQAKITISDDQGKTWRKVESLTTQWESVEPDVAAGFQSAVVVWRDHREATGQIYAQQYFGLIGSSNWGLLSPGHSRRPMVDMSNRREWRAGKPIVTVTWESRRQPLDPSDIWVAQNFDPNKPSTYQIYQVTNNSAESISPKVALADDQAWLFWRDGRSGNWELYFSEYDFQWSTNNPFLPSDRLRFENSPVWPAVSSYRYEVHLVWVESIRQGPNRLLYRRRDTESPERPYRPNHVDLDAPPGFDNDQNLIFVWEKTPGSTNYQVWISINQSEFEKVGQTDQLRFSYLPPINNTSYRLQIQAVDSVGNKSPFSLPSKPIYVDYHPPKLELHTPIPISLNTKNADQIPVIISPKVMVTATCLDDNLISCQLRLGVGRLPILSDNWQDLGPPIRAPFQRERIYIWDTKGLDGIYTLSLIAVDSVQNQTAIQSQVIIDNQQPLPISGGLGHRLTSNRVDVSDYTPAWSPDGSFIAFSSNAGGSVDIWILELSSGERTRLTQDQWIDLHPSWHPNGEKITFQSKRPQTNSNQLDWEIWSINTNGTGLRRQLDRPAQTASWSPKGDQLAVAMQHNNNEEIFLARLNPPPTTYRQLTRNNHQDMFPTWSPDMIRIAFQSNRTGNWDIWLTNVEQNDEPAEQLLRQSFANETQPRWAPNGKYILFLTDQPGNYKTAFVATLLNSTTSEVKPPTRLTPLGISVTSANWSPTIKQLIYQSKDQLHINPIIFPTVQVEAQIIKPYNQDLVFGKVDLIGLARGPQFQEFYLHYASAASSVRDWIPIGDRATQPVTTIGFLGQWDTRRLSGEYILRLTVISNHPDGNQTVTDQQIVLVENHKPTLEIFIPFDGTITDQKIITLRGQVASDAELYVNNTRVMVEDDGLFTNRILLKTGENLLHLRAVSSILGTTEMYRTVIQDLTPPVLTLNQPNDFMISPVPYVLISGNTDNSTIQIQQQSTKEEKVITIPVHPNGTFHRSVGLQFGTNTISVLAKDQFSRQSQLFRRIIYSTAETKNQVGHLAPNDTYPPGIVDLFPANDQVLNLPEEFIVSTRLLDNIKIDPFSLTFDFDDQKFHFDPNKLADMPKGIQFANFDGNVFTFNSETGKFVYRPAQELSQGKHQFKLQVSDIQGNQSVPVSARFTIDRQTFYASLSAIRDENYLWVHLVSNKILTTVGNAKVTTVPALHRQGIYRAYSIDLQLVSLEQLKPQSTREIVEDDLKNELTAPELGRLFIYQGQFQLTSQTDSFDLSADLSISENRLVMLRRIGYYTDQNQFQPSPILPFPQKRQGYSSTLVPYQIQHPRGASLTFLNPQMNLKPQLCSQDGFNANRELRQLQDAKNRQLEIVYPVHEIKLDVTAEVLQHSNFELRIPSQHLGQTLESTALFYWQQSWQPVANVQRTNIENQIYLVAIIDKLGSYGLLVDRNSPTIEPYQTNEQLIELKIADKGSGIDRLLVQIDQNQTVTLTNSLTSQTINKGMRFRQVDSFISELIYLPGSLPSGRHTLNVTAFDRAGNATQFKDTFFSEDIFDFVGPIFAYPNPVIEQAQIHFQLTKTADVELDIYSVTGELIYTSTLSNITGSNINLKWNCLNQNQRPVTPGIYIFNLTATNSGRSIQRSGKIAVLNSTDPEQ